MECFKILVSFGCILKPRKPFGVIRLVIRGSGVSSPMRTDTAGVGCHFPHSIL